MRVKTLIKLLERLDPETIISREISEIEVTNTFLDNVELEAISSHCFI